MNHPSKKRSGDTTVVAGKTDPRLQKYSATQILSAAEARAAKRSGKRSGDSSVILEGESIRRTGLGVSLKFALAISSAISVFMILFGIVVIRDFEGALNEEIDAAGVAAAKSLSMPDFATWSAYHGAYADTDWAKFEAAIARGERTRSSLDLTPDEKARAERRIAANSKRLEPMLSKDARILNALISNADRTKILLQAGGESVMDFRGTKQPDVGDVKVEYGTFRDKQQREVSARQYSAPIRGVTGSVDGYGTIILSETSIQEKLAAIQADIALFALVFIGLGVGVAFWMGNRITRPLTDLTHDVEVIAEGDLDHHTRVASRDEIGVLARTIERMAKSLSAAQREQLDHAKQKHQLQVALEIQAGLFPKELPYIPGYDVASHYQPGPEVGGDYYDVIVLPDGRWLMMVASASGKGIPAAMLTTMARSFVTALAEREKSPQELLKVVNRLLSPDLRRGLYVTALVCVLDPKTGKVVVANAGHNPLILYSAAEKKLRTIHSDGIGLGFDKGPVFDRSLREIELELKLGDRVVMCTPGLFGIKDHEGKELGEPNFYRLVEREAGKDSSAFVKLVAHALGKFGESGWMETDITFVTLQRAAT